MKENTGMYFFRLHFMDHGFDSVVIQLIYKNGIIMMNIRFNELIDVIAEKQRLVVEVDFYIHGSNKDTGFWILDIWMLDQIPEHTSN